MGADKLEIDPLRTTEEVSARFSSAKRSHFVLTGEQVAKEIELPSTVEVPASAIREVLAFMASEYRVFQEKKRRTDAGFMEDYGELWFRERFEKQRALLERLGLGSYLDQIEQVVNNNMTPNPYKGMDRVGL